MAFPYFLSILCVSCCSHAPAYGQTGSGKTHTMMGPPDHKELWGVNRRAVAELFDTCAKRTDSEFSLKVQWRPWGAMA